MDFNATLHGTRPPIRIGIIGLGRAAIFNHLPALRRLPDLFRIFAVCDLLKERRDIIEKEFPDARMYRQVSDMLDDPDIDLVDIALPSMDHVRCALAALRKNRWTVVEAPLALTHDDANRLRAASMKARGKLLTACPDLFSPDFLLAKKALEDPRLGDVFEVRIRKQTYVRRDDWQAVKRCGGGAIWYAGQGAVLQALQLLGQPPTQLWSELKRVASLGDAEDFAHIVFKTRGEVTVDIEICGGQLAPLEPSFTVRGSRGSFTVAPGAAEGVFHVVDPAHKFPRRRSSVRTPPLDDMSEPLPVVDIPLALSQEVDSGPEAFWRAVHDTMRVATPFPVQLDDAADTIRYLQLMKQSSPFAK